MKSLSQKLMNIKKTKFSGLKVISRKIHSDNRGILFEIYKKEIINKNFVFSIFSLSRKNVVRGLHIQTKNPQGKFLTVLRGKIFDVSLDLRSKSRTFKKTFCITLDAKNSKSIYIPEGFAHGFKALEKDTIVQYQLTKPREPNYEYGILYNDKNLKIKWPNKKKYILSKKDKLNLTLKDFLKINPF